MQLVQFYDHNRQFEDTHGEKHIATLGMGWVVGCATESKSSNCGAIKQQWAATATPLHSVTKLERLQTRFHSTFSSSLSMPIIQFGFLTFTIYNSRWLKYGFTWTSCLYKLRLCWTNFMSLYIQPSFLKRKGPEDKVDIFHWSQLQKDNASD